jgi:uncharacterized protein YegJ (DUF2314 family)
MRTAFLFGLCSLLSAVAAQSPTALPAPAILMLCRTPMRLDVSTCRAAWAKALDAEVGNTPQPTAAWLRAEGDTLVGGRDGRRFVVEASRRSLDLDAASLRHLDEGQRAQLQGHRAVVQVRCTSELAADAVRNDVYQLLARVAAAVAPAGVLGIGASDHGTFEVAPAPAKLREYLLGEDPLGWLEPTAGSSLVLFTKRKMPFEEQALLAALRQEFGAKFATDEEAGFVTAKDGIAMVLARGGMVMLHWSSGVESMRADVERFPDLRLRKAVTEHRATLNMSTFGPATDAAEAERRRLLGRVAAALWSDDVLLLNWHCDLALVIADADRPAQLRSEDPVAATLGKALVPVLEPGDDVAMAAAIAEARREWPTAAAHHVGGGALSAKFPFANRLGGNEHTWIAVTRIDGDAIHGTLANDPVDFDGKLGDPVVCKLSELSDWLFERDGKMVGGFTVKVLDAQKAKKPPK